jgi:prefoldin subunit 5
VPKPLPNKEKRILVPESTSMAEATIEEEENAWMSLGAFSGVNQTTEATVDTSKKKRAYVRKNLKNETQGVSGSSKNKK